MPPVVFAGRAKRVRIFALAVCGGVFYDEQNGVVYALEKIAKSPINVNLTSGAVALLLSFVPIC